jgi:hypothetical protein
MKVVELRGLEPLTPSLPEWGPRSFYLRLWRNSSKKSASKCNWLQFNAVQRVPVLQICSRHTSVNANHHFNAPYYVPSSVRHRLTGINTESACPARNADSHRPLPTPIPKVNTAGRAYDAHFAACADVPTQGYSKPRLVGGLRYRRMGQGREVAGLHRSQDLRLVVQWRPAAGQGRIAARAVWIQYRSREGVG